MTNKKPTFKDFAFRFFINVLDGAAIAIGVYTILWIISQTA